MDEKILLKNNGYDIDTLRISVNSEYFYRGGENWKRPFVCKVTGTAGNLERWDAGYLFENMDGVYDFTVSSTGSSAEEAADWWL